MNIDNIFEANKHRIKELFKKLRCKAISSSALRRLLSDDEIDVLCQNVWEQFIKQQQSIREPEKWLHTVTVNTFNKWAKVNYRNLKRIETIEETINKHTTPLYNPENELIKQSMLEQLKKCIESSLKFNEKVMIFLRYYKVNFSLTEIEIMQLFENVIPTLNESYQKINDALLKWFEEENINSNIIYYVFHNDIKSNIDNLNDVSNEDNTEKHLLELKIKLFDMLKLNFDDNEKLVFLIRYYTRELNIDDVMFLLNKTEDSVKSLSKRARNKLNLCMEVS